jgi:hypothetical protein
LPTLGRSAGFAERFSELAAPDAELVLVLVKGFVAGMEPLHVAEVRLGGSVREVEEEEMFLAGEDHGGKVIAGVQVGDQEEEGHDGIDVDLDVLVLAAEVAIESRSVQYRHMEVSIQETVASCSLAQPDMDMVLELGVVDQVP